MPERSPDVMLVVCWDLETTGFSRERDRITQIAACAGWLGAEGGPLPPPFATLVNAGLPVPGRVAKITGITTARLRAPGVPTEKEAVDALEEWMAGLGGRRHVLVAHNGKAFDEPFLSRLLVRTGRPPFEAWARRRRCVALLDSLRLFRSLPATRGLPKHTLTALHVALLHREFPAHDALEDVRALLRVLQAGCKEGDAGQELRRLPRNRACQACARVHSVHWPHSCGQQ
jgi:DNA polymerase III epsilon subunit-like protein